MALQVSRWWFPTQVNSKEDPGKFRERHNAGKMTVLSKNQKEASASQEAGTAGVNPPAQSQVSRAPRGVVSRSSEFSLPVHQAPDSGASGLTRRGVPQEPSH